MLVEPGDVTVLNVTDAGVSMSPGIGASTVISVPQAY